MRTIWDELHRLHREMDTIFGGMDASRLLEGPGELTNIRQPLADVCETDKAFVATLELPGIDKEEIDVRATGYGVEVRAQRSDEAEHSTRDIYRYERRYKGFYRHIPLPESADTEKVDATYENGILTLTIPKRQLKDERRKRITVK